MESHIFREVQTLNIIHDITDLSLFRTSKHHFICIIHDLIGAVTYNVLTLRLDLYPPTIELYTLGGSRRWEGGQCHYCVAPWVYATGP